MALPCVLIITRAEAAEQRTALLAAPSKPPNKEVRSQGEQQTQQEQQQRRQQQQQKRVEKSLERRRPIHPLILIRKSGLVQWEM